MRTRCSRRLRRRRAPGRPRRRGSRPWRGGAVRCRRRRSSPGPRLRRGRSEAGQGEPGLQHGLGAARGDDAGQGPAGEGQVAFVGAGGEEHGPGPYGGGRLVGSRDGVQRPVAVAGAVADDGPDVVEGQVGDAAGGAVGVEAAGPGGEVPPPVVQGLGPPGAQCGGGVPVELAAGPFAGVEEGDGEPEVGGGDGGGEAGGAGADDGEVSGAVMAGALLGGDGVAGADGDQAGALVGAAVDGGEAVVAAADAAERAARRPAAAGGPPGEDPGGPQGGGEGLPGERGEGAPVEGEGVRLGGFGPYEAEGAGARGAAHRAAPRKRSGRNGAGSRGGSPPRRAAVTRRPVAGARPMPAPSWPQAWCRPGTRGSGPMAGRWSGR